MEIWHTIQFVVAFVTVPFVLYGLHRLCLGLERRGWIYYMHRRPESTGTGVCIALQEIIEPSARQIIQVEDEAVEGDAQGDDSGKRRPRLVIRQVPRRDLE
jgi:hypothetical protein